MEFGQLFPALFALLSAVCLRGSAFKYNDCPGPISVDTAADSATAAVTWRHPYLTGLGRVGSVSQTVSHDPGEEFPVGLTRVNYLAINSTDYRDLQVCTFVITVHDRIAPVFTTCPINATSRLGPDQNQTAVTWDTPVAVDNSKYVRLLSDHQPGANLTAGTVLVTYTARDTTGNQATCQFPVIVVPFLVATTTGTTTAAAAATTTVEDTTVGQGPGEGTDKNSGPGVVAATPIDWNVWVNHGLIVVSALCLLAFAVVAFFVFRKYRALRRLKQSRLPGAEEAETYPSSGGEEYDMWEDPPAGPAYQVISSPGGASPGGRGEQRRPNKAEERPLLVAAGGEQF